MCHCCGDQTDVLPWFEKWGIDAVHPLQPKCNNIYQVREQYPDLTLIGNIDIDIPDIDVPDIDVPDIDVPNIDIPDPPA